MFSLESVLYEFGSAMSRPAARVQLTARVDYTARSERMLSMTTYLGMGSNLGDRREALRRALAALTGAGIAVRRVSPTVESPAMLAPGAPPEWNRPFLNLVVEVDTDRAPAALLAELKRIEATLGRGPHERWSPRPIDIDILLWGERTLASESLTIPHPGLAERNFVLTPLVALRPDLRLPGADNRTVLERSRALGRNIPLWMGIVNLTPDSFSDGGDFVEWPQIEKHIEALTAAGAQILDFGAESTRPGAAPLTASAELARLLPVLERVVAKLADDPLRPLLSVDTYHPVVAARAVELGVDIVNDVSGLTTPEMLEVAAAGDAQWVAMHNLGLPADPKRTLPPGTDAPAEVERWLEARLEDWSRAGLDLARIVFDPGVGFGKNPLQSLALLRDVDRFLRYPLRCLIGHSRKSFMLGFASAERAERDLVTVGASLRLCAAGVDVLRVHNVAAHTAAYRGWAHAS
jgi:2-amino-4-hydroxy-6-hydroxymethyldihydropteridine diphosphokinase/dihydropteroate synthase